MIITFNNGLSTIYDNKSGGLGSDSAMFHSGSIDYATGDLAITFTSVLPNTDINITYQKNVINLVVNETSTTIDSSGTLVIASECIKYT